MFFFPIPICIKIRLETRLGLQCQTPLSPIPLAVSLIPNLGKGTITIFEILHTFIGVDINS